MPKKRMSPEQIVVLLRQIEVQQDEIWARAVRAFALAAQEGHRLDAVERDVQVNRRVGQVSGHVGVAERLLGQPHVARAVFDQQDV